MYGYHYTVIIIQLLYCSTVRLHRLGQFGQVSPYFGDNGRRHVDQHRSQIYAICASLPIRILYVIYKVLSHTQAVIELVEWCLRWAIHTNKEKVTTSGFTIGVTVNFHPCQQVSSGAGR